MKRSLGVRKLAGFMFVSVAGTFLHFLYDITGRNMAAGLLSAVNESIWEHMKLIFYPMLLVSLAEHRLVKEDRARLRCSTLAGILLALMLIPVLYYSYTGILGISADWFNVTIFFIAAGAAYWLAYRIESSAGRCRISIKLWVLMLLMMAGVFTAATFYPPRIPLFRDPRTGTWGIWERG